MTPNTKIWLKSLLKVLLLTAVLAVFSRLPGVREFLAEERLKELAESMGWKGGIILIALAACVPITFFPRWPFAWLFGMLYGVGKGIVFASVAGVTGAILHYLLVAFVLSDKERAAYESMAWYQKLQKMPRPFWMITAIRLFPFSNFAVTNIGCALLRIPLRIYFLSALVGMLPSTVMYVLIGRGGSWWLLGALVIAALLVPLAALLSKKK